MTEATGSTTKAEKLIMFLAQDCHCGSVEVAETLWLALKIEPKEQPVLDPSVPLSPPPSVPTAPPPSTPADPIPTEPISSVAASPPPAPDITPRANLNLPTLQPQVLPEKILPIWVVDPSLLRDPLAILRALKPLIKQVDAGVGCYLAEQETVDFIARTGLWLPQMEAEREAWFDLVLVADQGSSMQIWQGLVRNLTRILRRYGVLRDVKVLNLVIDRSDTKPEDTKPQDPVRLQTPTTQTSHRYSEVIEQRGRRIVVVLSDCVGDYWWDGTVLPMLQAWGKVMPTVIWQVLPEWMWERTALGQGTAVGLRNSRPGVANQCLGVEWPEQVQEEALQPHQRVPVPVVTSAVNTLANWSGMLAGDRREVTPGYLLPAAGGTVPRRTGQSWDELVRQRLGLPTQGTLSLADQEAVNQALYQMAQERVQRFRQLSSPTARRLLVLLAAAPVITLPVVHLLANRMLSAGLEEECSPLPVAEVFLSGLLQRLPGQEEVRDFKAVQYDFVHPVRDVLLESLPEGYALEVINQVSAEIERRWYQVTFEDFQAFLTDPTVEAPDGLEGLRSFATMTADILDRLGGAYREFAQTLRRGESSNGDGSEVEFPDLPPLEELEVDSPKLVRRSEEEEPDAEQAETEDWPPIHEETVQSTKLELDETPPTEDWPALEQETLIMKTVEFEEEPEADLGIELERFSYQIAKVRRERGNWRVFYSPGHNTRYIERLENGDQSVDLEMVQIPAGQFWMGSDRATDPDYDSSEVPKHQVQVPPFFLGRYPVTQAQWRVVAGWDKVKQDLDPDPANFKGADRPVEQVSWHDAVEFCARLAQRTGRDYRLPSEAEWEYACRAGTTTPFAFGKMITTAVANYNGTAWQSGPQGRGRGGTTPVGSVRGGNAWGLSDMHGNAWEWCADPWHSNYEGAPTDGSVWQKVSINSGYVLRGGSWYGNPRNCRSANRLHRDPGYRYHIYGFRLACSPRGSSPV